MKWNRVVKKFVWLSEFTLLTCLYFVMDMEYVKFLQSFVNSTYRVVMLGKDWVYLAKEWCTYQGVCCWKCFSVHGQSHIYNYVTLFDHFKSFIMVLFNAQRTDDSIFDSPTIRHVYADGHVICHWRMRCLMLNKWLSNNNMWVSLYVHYVIKSVIYYEWWKQVFKRTTKIRCPLHYLCSTIHLG